MPNALLHIRGNATNAGKIILEHLTNTPTIEILRATGTASALYNWNILNDDAFKIQSKNLATSYATRFDISGVGNVGIGNATEVASKLCIGGSLRTTSHITATTGNITGVGLYGELTELTQPLLNGGFDMITLKNNNNNSLSFKQNFIATNDISFNIIQKSNTVDITIFTFRNGNIAVGTSSNPI